MVARHKLLVILMVLMFVFTYSSVVLGVGKGKAKYVGGTLASITERTEGAIDLKGEDKLVFIPKKGSLLEIPWTSIDEIEYGQKVGRRVATAILVSPLALFSKARKHFVTVSFKDANGKDQAVVFEFDKNDIRQTLTILKVRTGKEIIYQDEEAKKQMGGGAENNK
jgi:hypothetical protein